ncbi:MAG: FAD-dependent oxidoreductase, partial [Clostridia bacterium]|nr:FAD-dependent oxidoreductase [Clostridia bacterium]
INEEFVKHGAPDEIKYSSKPHIGTDYLYKTVKNIREEIISLGGTFLFETTLKDIIIKDGKVVKAVTDKGEIECDRLVLATGHSSRDTYKMLYEKGVNMEKKPFSVGVRIEHKREYINLLQYKSEEFAETLPAADYKLSCHSQDRGAYTFCMCPGGVVVCGASGEGQVVTNGMSYFARDKENSNAAFLVSVLPEDIKGGVLDAIKFQEDLERKAYIKGGENYFAPVQLVKDFLEDRESTKSGNVKPSYLPGVKYTSLKDVLPDFVIEMLKFAIVEFDRKMKGFNIGDAVLTGVETRSSAPLRILRDESFQSNIKGLYPIGEGAGYAGGIMSSAIDGINCAEKIIDNGKWRIEN